MTEREVVITFKPETERWQVWFKPVENRSTNTEKTRQNSVSFD